MALNKLRKWVFVIYLVSFGSHANAYDHQYYMAMFDVFDTELSPRLLRMLPPSERNALNGVELQLWMNPSTPSALVTRTNPSEIIISLGFMDGLFQHIDCLLLEGELSNLPSDFCATYFLYYIKEIIDPNSPQPDSAARFLFGTDGQAIDRWYGDPKRGELRNQMMSSSLIFLFMHEYGHHIMGFYSEEDNLFQKRQIEASADLWAAQTLDRIGERPTLGAALSFGYIARLEAYRIDLANRSLSDPNFVQLASPHPLPFERMSWSFDRYCSAQILEADSTMTGPCEFISELMEAY